MAWVEKRVNGYVGRYKHPETEKNHTAGRSPSKREALRLAQEQEAKIRRGTWVNPSGPMTFGEYFEHHWMPHRVMEQNTRRTYWSHYHTALKPEFGDVPLVRIRYEHVQGWVARMQREGVSPATVNARCKALQTVLSAPRGGMSAMRSRLIANDPCHGIDLPTVPQREVTIYEPEEVDRILAVMDPYWALVPLLASELGLRWGELLGLRVEDFSVGMRQVTVRRTIVETRRTETGNGTRFARKDYPKSKRPRVLPLAPEVGQAVARQIALRELGPGDRLLSMPAELPPGRFARGANYDATPFVATYTPRRTVVWPEGEPIGRTFCRTGVWLPTLAKIQQEDPAFPVRRIHDLRASAISWLLYAGTPTGRTCCRSVPGRAGRARQLDHDRMAAGTRLSPAGGPRTAGADVAPGVCCDRRAAGDHCAAVATLARRCVVMIIVTTTGRTSHRRCTPWPRRRCRASPCCAASSSPARCRRASSRPCRRSRRTPPCRRTPGPPWWCSGSSGGTCGRS